MISGALLLDERKEFHLYKSLKRLFIPLLLWSVLYAMLVITYQYKSFTEESLLALLQLTFLTPTHNWFLYMLIGVYLLTPLCKAIVKSNKSSYFIILWVIFGVTTSFMKHFDAFYLLNTYIDRFSLTMPLGYIGYFILGHKLHATNFKMTKSRLYGLIFMSIMCIILNIIGTHIESVKLGYTSEVFYDNLSPIVVIYSICILLC